MAEEKHSELSYRADLIELNDPSILAISRIKVVLCFLSCSLSRSLCTVMKPRSVKLSLRTSVRDRL